MKFFKNHVLVETFQNLEGNPKMSLITEPLWFIPYSLFIPFQSIYMRELGLTEEQIGLTITVGLLFQMFFSVLGGIVTDKMGRRLSTYIFDVIAWTVPCFIWAFSQNVWWFLIASGFNGCMQVTTNSWRCLFIEDCPPKYLRNAFLLIQMCGMLAVFFSPIAIYFVGEFGVVPVVRVLYFISAISMFFKFYLLYKYGSETQIGKKRLEETKNITYFQMLLGYKDVMIMFLKSPKMLFVMVFISIVNIATIPTTTFFSLYVTETLLLPSQLIAVFPMVRTGVAILFVLGLQNICSKINMRRGAVVGFSLYIASHLMLIFAPPKSIVMVLCYTFLEAVAYSFIVPRKDEITALYVDKTDRSRIFGIYNATMIAITTPFGIIIGEMFARNSKSPFYFNIVLYTAAMILILTSKDIKNHESENIK